MRKVLFILGGLKDDDLQWLLDAGVREQVPEGGTIITEGGELDQLYIIIDGEFSVTVGHGAREIARLSSGEVVGDMSLLDSRPPNATVSARTPSQVFAIPHAVLRDKLGNDDGFAARFYHAISIFLANRLNRAVLMAGTPGRAILDERVTDEDEISEDVLDTASLAGARFVWFLAEAQRK